MADKETKKTAKTIIKIARKVGKLLDIPETDKKQDKSLTDLVLRELLYGKKKKKQKKDKVKK